MIRLKDLRLAYKLYLGFGLLVAVFVLYAFFVSISLDNNEKTYNQVTEKTDPLLVGVQHLNSFAIKLKMLSTNWVYLRSNENDKAELGKLIDKEYPVLKSSLNGIAKGLNNKELNDNLSLAFNKLDQIIAISNSIRNQLKTFEDYEDPLKKIISEDAIEIELIPLTQELNTYIDAIIQKSVLEKTIKQNQVITDLQNIKRSIWIVSVLAVILAIMLAYSIGDSLIKPIKNLNKALSGLGRGRITHLNFEKRGDEIGTMYNELHHLSIGLTNTARFADEIGKGNLSDDFTPMSDGDILGNSLLKMREELTRVHLEDQRRNWITQGLAKLSDTLRNFEVSQEEFYDTLLRDLVKYIDVNQGAVFIINDDNSNDLHLQMHSCYAYKRKKFIDKRIDLQEGLAGQCFVDKDLIYITDVPEDYISIESGLGESLPSCILLLPLVLNDVCVGVIELASLEVIEDYKIEFLRKISENIASVVITVKNSTRTNHLLEDFTKQQQELKEQEEEMRQNLEELVATQEEMHRKEARYAEIFKEIKIKYNETYVI